MKITKHTLTLIGWMLLLLTSASAETYKSEHFIIHSDLDARYVNFVQINAEAYYKNLEEKYFKTGGNKPITIYYSETQSDTQKLFNQHGLTGNIYYGQYVSSIPAVYTHRLMDTASASGWGTIFHEITHHFIHINYKNAPTWFNEGLACFLGEQSRIVKGKLVIGRPNPWREYLLREMVEDGRRIDIKYLTSLSSSQFHKDRNHYHPCRAIFYWLFETGRLLDYLENVRQKGYELSVLEQTVSKSYSEIDAELLKFVKKHCYAGAYLREGQLAESPSDKKAAFIKAIELKPDYKAAQFKLAYLYYRAREYEKCRSALTDIMDDTECIEYQGAAKLFAHTLFNEKNYKEALKYYKKALEYSDYDEYQYLYYYYMANCNHHLKDYVKAKNLYKLFLDNNWEPERAAKAVEHAAEYQQPDVNNIQQNQKSTEE